MPIVQLVEMKRSRHGATMSSTMRLSMFQNPAYSIPLRTMLTRNLISMADRDFKCPGNMFYAYIIVKDVE